MTDGATQRFLGGSPLTVLVRLAAVSLVVGALMSWLGLSALDLLDEVHRAVEHLYGTGFAALRGIGQTALAGAAVVVPVWLALRVLQWRGPRARIAPDGGRRDGASPRWGDPGRVRD